MRSSLTNGNLSGLPMRELSLRAKLLRIALLAALGGAAGYAVGRLIAQNGLFDGVEPIPPADVMALALAFLLVLMGVWVAIVSTRSAWFARAVEQREPGDTDPVDPAAIRSARIQAVVCVIAGAVLAVPPLAVAAELTDTARSLTAIALLALIVAQTWLNGRLWRMSDELTRTMIVQTGAACFWGLQLALFTWAALARIGLLPDFGTWIAAIVTMAVYLVASMVVGVRLGLARV